MVTEKEVYNVIANYHTHTYRCKHARGDDREYVEAAIASGLKVLGFSDHTPYPTGTGYESFMRMAPEEFEGYVTSLSNLREEYKKDIDIYIGVEAEYFPAYFDKLVEFMKDYPLDYMILGNHFVDDEEHGRSVGVGFKDVEILSRYADNVIEAMKSGRFAYIAHPDLPLYVGEGGETVRAAAFRKICKAAKEYNVPLEINVNGYTRGIQYPSDTLFSVAAECGNDVIVGFDVHDPKQFFNKDDINYCANIAKKYNLNLLKTLEL